MPIDKTLFSKNVTTGLFVELANDNTTNPVFTVTDEDKELRGKTYISMYKLYMDMEDLSEVKFANKYLHGYSHWRNLCDNDTLMPYIARWRYELELKLKAKALESIIQTSKDPESKHFHDANKFLLTGKWELAKRTNENDLKKNKRGRPSKEEIQALADIERDKALKALEDLNRIENLTNEEASERSIN